MTPKTLIACLIAVVSSTAQVEAQVATKEFSSIFTLGDSLTDDGNLFKLIGTPRPPYWEGRFSNGPVWAEQLATALGVNANEFHGFAVGGASTTDVANQQVKALLAANNNRLPADVLYLYWAGANDLLTLMSSQNGNPETTIMIAMGQTASALSSLLLAGAKTIVVVGLPDLSKTPRVVALKDPVISAGAAALAQAYNNALAALIKQLEAVFKVDILELDAFALIRDITSDRKKYMLKKVDKPLLRTNGKVHRHANRYLFFDEIHPTFAGHRLIMRAGLRVLGRQIPGDVNGDFVVNKKDLKALRKVFGPCGSPCPADLNGDGSVNKEDQELLEAMLAKDL